jgi:hypothetical protein
VERPVKLSVYWRFVLCAYEMMMTYFCMYGKKSGSGFVENVRCHLVKFSLLGDQACVNPKGNQPHPLLLKS